METQSAHRRSGHYEQTVQITERVVLTDRDLDAFLLLHENVFAHTRHMQALFGERFDERLRKLKKHGWITAPKSQRSWRRIEGGGSRPLAYARTERSERALLAAGMIRRSRGDWAKPHRKRSRYMPSLKHHLAVADVRVLFHQAYMMRGWKLVAASELAGKRDVSGIAVPRRREFLYPDWMFAIACGAHTPSLFFVEVDRTHEPNERSEREEDEREADEWDSMDAQSHLRPKFDGYRA